MGLPVRVVQLWHSGLISDWLVGVCVCVFVFAHSSLFNRTEVTYEVMFRRKKIFHGINEENLSNIQILQPDSEPPVLLYFSVHP